MYTLKYRYFLLITSKNQKVEEDRFPLEEDRQKLSMVKLQEVKKIIWNRKK